MLSIYRLKEPQQNALSDVFAFKIAKAVCSIHKSSGGLYFTLHDEQNRPILAISRETYQGIVAKSKQELTGGYIAVRYLSSNNELPIYKRLEGAFINGNDGGSLLWLPADKFENLYCFVEPNPKDSLVNMNTPNEAKAAEPTIDHQSYTLMIFDPVNGGILNKRCTTEEYRTYNGNIAWLYNPWTGEQRDPRDIGSDVCGHLIRVNKLMPWQKLLGDELVDAHNRHVELCKFIDSHQAEQLPKPEHRLFVEQTKIMGQYLDVLRRRAKMTFSRARSDEAPKKIARRIFLTPQTKAISDDEKNERLKFLMRTLGAEESPHGFTQEEVDALLIAAELGFNFHCDFEKSISWVEEPFVEVRHDDAVGFNPETASRRAIVLAAAKARSKMSTETTK